MHFSFTRERHLLHPLGSPDDNYVMAAAKIPCSSLLLATDSHLHRLYLYDMRNPNVLGQDEMEGYHRNDLSISSVHLRDELDGDAVCADLCVDDAGYNIYALMMSTGNGGAWIKVYRHINRKLYDLNLRYRLTEDRTPLTVIFDKCADLGLIGPTTHIGEPFRYNALCYGTGIEILNGSLYVLTRRRVNAEFVTRARYNAMAHTNSVQLTPEEAEGQQGEEKYRGASKLYKLRLYEKRTAELQFSLLTKMTADSGEVRGNYYLSYPGTTNDYSKDAVFHGLSRVDGKLLAGIRYDHALVPSDLSLWHLVESTSHSALKKEMGWIVEWDEPDEDGNRKLLKGQAVGQVAGFLTYAADVVEDTKPASVAYGWLSTDRVKCTKIVNDFIRRVNSLALASTQQATPIKQTRGQTALVSIEEPASMNMKDLPTYLPLLDYKIENNHYPFGVALPYSMTTDGSTRVMYGVFGNQLWLFDILDYTLIVRHPVLDEYGQVDHYDYFEGDIIDMADILEANRSELQCFIRNDSDFDMLDVHLIIETDKDNDHSRTNDVFLSYLQGEAGTKDLALGDIVPGGSKEFWIEVHPLYVQVWEAGTTHNLPLRVQYSTDSDLY